jgi:protein-L-isoaspartate(D-aspartate) O-methyltransferase
MNWLKKITSPASPALTEPPLPEQLFDGPFGPERRRMVERHLRGRDVRDGRILAAMARVPRERFVAVELNPKAYDDGPLSIGHEQTISQPYMVAKMTELAAIQEGSRVLEVGVGSGYQTAVLLELGARVFGLEIVEPLAEAARGRLEELGYADFFVDCRDGYEGLPEAAPFDAIILAASPEHVPAPLLDQLAPGGRLVAPIGPLDRQQLNVYTRTPEGIRCQPCFSVRFVPMTGRAQDGPERTDERPQAETQ